MAAPARATLDWFGQDDVAVVVVNDDDQVVVADAGRDNWS
jgi:hypothetical protein